MKSGTLVSKDPDCDIYLWKEGQSVTTTHPIITEIEPVEIHISPDGTENDQPALVFVFETDIGLHVAASISLETIWPAIETAIRAKKDLV